MPEKLFFDITKYPLPINKNFVREIPAPFDLQRAFRIEKHPQKGLLVIATIAVEEDGCFWLHASFSRKDRIPDYKDILLVKEQFFGDDLKAIMIFPSKEEYVNIHQNCLHLWANLTKDYLPDFRTFGNI